MHPYSSRVSTNRIIQIQFLVRIVAGQVILWISVMAMYQTLFI